MQSTDTSIEKVLRLLAWPHPGPSLYRTKASILLKRGRIMTGKHYNWHKAWRWQGQRLAHDSGLAFELNDALGITTCGDTLEAWQAFEMARGVPLHDLQSRLKRLTREAAKFYERNPQP